MDELAMVLLALTMGGGALLALAWHVLGGSREPDGRGVTMGRVTAHASIAVVAAIVWGMHLAAGDELGYEVAGPFSWALMLVVAGFGLSMFLGWRATRRNPEEAEHRPSQRRLHPIPVLAHGALAAATIVVAGLALL